jgi:hypothetical protein
MTQRQSGTRPLIMIVVALFATALIGATEEATFRATASGEISGGPQSHVNGITPKTTRVVIRLMPLDLSLLATVEGGEACFWQANYEGPLTVERDKSGNAFAQYFFTARGNDGVTDVKYLLEMKGTFEDPSNWLPVVGTSARMLVSDWSVAAESKGQARQACSGAGTVTDTSILIERLP